MSITTVELGRRPFAGDDRPEIALGGRRRVLVVAPEVPTPPRWGFALRVHHLARELARRHDVYLLAFGDSSRVSDATAVFHHATLVHQADSVKRIDQLVSLSRPQSYHLNSRRSAEMQSALDEIVDRFKPDVVQIESTLMSWLRVPEGPVVVLDEHNIESELLERIAGVEQTPARALYARLEAWKVRREELLAWERADGVALTSTNDRDALRRRLPDAWSCVVPNGVDLDAWHPSMAGSVVDDRLVFVGSINYRPNTDAVRYMAREILPRIRARRPSAHLVVVGPGVPAEVARLRGPGVEFAGAVDDVRRFVASAAAVVVPLRVGSGTRIKVLEALAMGKAVVTSSIGCEGIAAHDGEHLLVADDPETFAHAVIGVLGDRARCARLGSAGRALVESAYGWGNAGARLDAFHAMLHARIQGGVT
jgi:polysaccharide biosynthesis protein PslH